MALRDERNPTGLYHVHLLGYSPRIWLIALNSIVSNATMYIYNDYTVLGTWSEFNGQIYTFYVENDVRL